MWTLDQIRELIVDVPDFPKEGIVFKDITPIFENHEAFVSLTRHFAKCISPEVKKMVAIESRGFILGAAIAQHLDIGMVLVRKPGKLPRDTESQSYSLEYGEDTLEIHKQSINKGEKLVIVDDILATGGTAAAVESLVTKLGAEVESFHFLMELGFLGGAEKLKANINSLIKL